MTIDSATVARIAHLARLKVPAEEQAQLTGELVKILNWIAQLDEVDTKDVEPLSNVNDDTLRMREDKVEDGTASEDVLANAPARTAGFFTVPKVIE